MSKKKKFTSEEREKLAQELAQELIAADTDLDLEILLGPSKKPRKSLKAPIEKVTSYHLIVESSVFWASRQTYLEIVQSFLSKKIDGETFTSKFFELKGKDMNSKDELCAIIEDRILPIPDLYYTFKAEAFNSAIGELFFEIDQYDPDIINDSEIDDPDWCDIVYSESQLRLVIHKEFVPIFQQSCGLNDSFFRP